MNDHRDESLIDKIKNAFGMGDDERAPDAVRDVPSAPTERAGTADDASPHVGYSEPFSEDIGGPANRPTGPDYGASDLPEDDFGAGPAIGTDDSYGTVSRPGPMGGGTETGAGTTMGAGGEPVPDQVADETGWTRGAASPGERQFDTDVDVVEQERRETGI